MKRAITRTARARRGFTLIEALIAASLLGIVVVKITMVLNSATQSHNRESSAMVLEDQAHRVLDQIAYAIMGAERDELVPDPLQPLYSTELNYSVSLGVEAGEVVFNDPERIGLGNVLSQLVWAENPGVAEERRVVWTNLVSPFLEGEIPNGVDDNGNGLVDESGLTFSLEGNAVTIRLSLARPQSDGTLLEETVETLVTCRN